MRAGTFHAAAQMKDCTRVPKCVLMGATNEPTQWAAQNCGSKSAPAAILSSRANRHGSWRNRWGLKAARFRSLRRLFRKLPEIFWTTRHRARFLWNEFSRAKDRVWAL